MLLSVYFTVFRHLSYPLLGACDKYMACSHKAAEQTMLMMDRLPQINVKATKAKASGVQTVLYMWCPRTRTLWSNRTS